MNSRRVEHCIETLCNEGCQNVWQSIETIESGQLLSVMDGLTTEECRKVLEELKNIMAVYDAAGSCAIDENE